MPDDWVEWAVAAAQIVVAVATLGVAVSALVSAKAALQASRRARPVPHLVWTQVQPGPSPHSIVCDGKIISTAPAVLFSLRAEPHIANEDGVAVSLVPPFVGVQSLVGETGIDIRIRVFLPPPPAESVFIELAVELQAFGGQEKEHWSAWSLFRTPAGIEVFLPFARRGSDVRGRLRARWRVWKRWVDEWRGDALA